MVRGHVRAAQRPSRTRLATEWLRKPAPAGPLLLSQGSEKVPVVPLKGIMILYLGAPWCIALGRNLNKTCQSRSNGVPWGTALCYMLWVDNTGDESCPKRSSRCRASSKPVRLRVVVEVVLRVKLGTEHVLSWSTGDHPRCEVRLLDEDTRSAAFSRGLRPSGRGLCAATHPQWKHGGRSQEAVELRRVVMVLGRMGQSGSVNTAIA